MAEHSIPGRTPSTELPFVLNCSRIPPQGGLKSFSLAMMQAVLNLGFPCRAVVPSGFTAPSGVETVFTPSSLAGASDLSLLRPLKWFAYSRFQFPVAPSQRILCTTHHVLPNRNRQIVTVHDIRPFFYPDTPVQGFYFRHMLPRALKRCDGVLTVSETSRRLIADTYNLPLDRIAVVPNVIERSGTAKEDKGHSAIDKAHPPYLLVVGASWPHKNVESLLERHTLWTGDYELIVIAGKGQYRAQLEQQVNRLGIASRVRFAEDLSASALDQLYCGCAALISPSRMEGFGMPALEAMAFRRPVLVAEIPVFRELYGNHAIYVQTDDTQSWQQAFAKLRTVTPESIEGAREHSITFDQSRMTSALQAALERFWGLRSNW